MKRFWVVMFLFLWLMSVLFISHLGWNARGAMGKGSPKAGAFSPKPITKGVFHES